MIRRLVRWLAIKTGAYPRFIINRWMRVMMLRTFRKYSAMVVDNVYEENQIIKLLAKKVELRFTGGPA